jgi:hypothetical protein
MVSYTFTNININDLTQLESAIKLSGITGLEYTNTDPNGLTIYFNNELSTEDQTKLSNIVTNFQEVSVELDATYQNILTVMKLINNNFWTVVCSWTYSGRYTENYKCIIINSFIKTEAMSADTYSLRLYDSQNNKVLWTDTLNNTEPVFSCINLDLELFPISITSLELHARVNSLNDYIEISNICLKH